MPEARYTTTARLPVETVWDFVREMDNWAGFVAGYRSHEKETERDSRWVLKGDVGVLARTLEFRVHITEWNGPSRVAFELVGLNEPMQGGGVFEMEPVAEGDTAAPSGASRNPLLRLLEAIVRFFLRLFRGRAERAAPSASAESAAGARLTFVLRIDPGGPMAPMVSAMMKPAMLPAAEDLANRIMARLEEIHGLKA